MINILRIKSILKEKGIILENIVSNPKQMEKACHTAYKSIPIPMRWIVGKKRVICIVTSIVDNISKGINKI